MRWKPSRAISVIVDLLAPGKIILELGSGNGTKILTKNFIVYSIENMREMIGKYSNNYIYAPIRFYDDEYIAPDIPGVTKNMRKTTVQKGWYDYKILEKKLPKFYDLIFIDGPVAKIGRAGFLKHLNLFNLSCPMVFDDVHRLSERILLERVAEKLGVKYEVIDLSKGSIGLINRIEESL